MTACAMIRWLHAPARRVAAGDRWRSPAPFDRDHGDLLQDRCRCHTTNCSTMTGGETMLTQNVESYLAVHRAMGFALHSEGTLLQSFAAFSEAAGKDHVCTETAIEWAGSARSTTTRARRLGQVIRDRKSTRLN